MSYPMPVQDTVAHECFKVVRARRAGSRSKRFELFSSDVRLDGYTQHYVPGLWKETRWPMFAFEFQSKAEGYAQLSDDMQVWRCETYTIPFHPQYISSRWVYMEQFWQSYVRGQRTEGFTVLSTLNNIWVNDIKLIERVI